MPTHDERISSLLAWYGRADESVKHEGRTWYDAQREVIREIARANGIEVERFAAIVATLSPMTRWTENLAGAIRLLHALDQGMTMPPRNTTLFYKNALKAWRILLGERPEELLSGSPKVHAFWRNLIGDEEAVTVDTWMLRAMGEAERFVNGLKPKPYREMAQAIRDAARMVGETPASFQAIVWVQIRREMSRYDTTRESA